MSANYLYIDAALTELKTLSDTLNSSFIVNGSNDNVCRTDYYGYDFLYTRVLMNLRNTPAQSVYIYNKDFLYYFLTCIVPIGCDIDEMAVFANDLTSITDKAYHEGLLKIAKAFIGCDTYVDPNKVGPCFVCWRHTRTLLIEMNKLYKDCGSLDPLLMAYEATSSMTFRNSMSKVYREQENLVATLQNCTFYINKVIQSFDQSEENEPNIFNHVSLINETP